MEDLVTVSSRLLVALFAGGLIGLERAYTGRPAGLRTHSLVCMSSSLLMLLTVFQWELLTNAPLDTVRVDPTRMAQGVMTGIGFLGAGVIMKEKFTIRGLTTASSIWMTASIGIILGMGFYTAGLLATVLTLVILSFFG
ncbi:MgtC/SapB family protein, partial [Kaarinaea lacus]